MRRVLVYSYSSESNYGGVSVILGFRELLRQVDPTAEMICVEDGPVPVFAREENDFPSIRWPYSRTGRFWADYVRFRIFGKKPRDPACAAWWTWFDAADTVVNLHGIAFCSKLKRAKRPPAFVVAAKFLLKVFAPNFVARLSGKLSVKSTASFGPADAWADRLTAWLSSRFVFDRMVAREMDSAHELQRIARMKDEPIMAPDVANLMPVPDITPQSDLVGIVTSFQMERQWKSKDGGYLEMMIGLADYLVAKGFRIVLIPNQDNGEHSRPVRRSDTRVATDILARVTDPSPVSVAGICGRSGLERKSDIAKCSLLISPRYHACVSAMTCAVPTLMLGWHAKYRELARLYGQEEWLIPSEKCSLKGLEEMLERMMARREAIADSIRAHQPAVRQSVIESGKFMLSREVGHEG